MLLLISPINERFGSWFDLKPNWFSESTYSSLEKKVVVIFVRFDKSDIGQ